jgi:hypothetical protein
MSVTEQLKIIHGIMDNMNAVERQIMSDKLLSYLLFDLNKAVEEKTGGNEINAAAIKKELTPDELKLIKELAKKTEDLKNLLGNNPDLFR